MVRFIFLVVALILCVITIYCYVINKSKEASIISAISTILSLVIAIYPSILGQEKVEPNITLNTNSLELINSDEYDLKAIISPNNYDIKWSSDNDSIVTVDNNGHLKAINEGNTIIVASITYKDVEYSDICNISVKNPFISLDSSYLLYIGETKNLSATTIPKEASIIWKSDNLDIVSVNDNGEIEGIAEGNATITATIVYDSKNYSATCIVTVKAQLDGYNNTNNNEENRNYSKSDEQKTIDSELISNSDLQESEINTISIRDVAWLDDEKIYKDDYATTMRGEEWSDCIRFGSSNINSDGTSVLRVVCDQKYNKFTAEIAPQEGFDKTESVTFYIYGRIDDQQTFKDEFQIDYSTKPFKVEYDLSNTDELYFWKSGNYNKGRIAGQYINGYTGMGILMRDAVLYK